MIKKILLILLVLLIATPQVLAASSFEAKNDTRSGKKPKPAFWKNNKIDLFYQKKQYRGLSGKYKDFSVGIVEVKDERMTRFYHKKDKFFQTKLMPTLQLLIKEELEHCGMFKEVKLVYEPFDGEMTPQKMEKIRNDYAVDMIMLVNLTDFQVIRGISDLHSKMMLDGNYIVLPYTLKGMDLNFRVGGIFQLVFLPLNYVVWSDTVEREYLQYAPKGALKSKEMEPIVQNLLSQVMTDMLYLISEDGKVIKTKK